MTNLDMQYAPYYYDSENRLNLLVKAVPYDGPVYLNKEDIQGHRFSKSTDLGREQGVSYLDHNKLKIDHPELDIATFPGIDEKVGNSEKALSTEEGVIYRIIVNENYRYKQMLKLLAAQNRLLGSTTPNQRTVKINEKTHEIERWEVGEVTLTWKAANPDAELVFLKSIEIDEVEELTMSKVMQDKEVQNTEETEAVVETVAAESTEPSMTELVQALDKTEEVESNPVEKSVPDMFAEIMNAISGFDARLAKVEGRSEVNEKSMGDLKTAFPMLVKQFDKYFTGKVENQKNVSHVEKSVVEKFQQQPVGTSTAPGRERKANFGKVD